MCASLCSSGGADDDRLALPLSLLLSRGTVMAIDRLCLAMCIGGPSIVRVGREKVCCMRVRRCCMWSGDSYNISAVGSIGGKCGMDRNACMASCMLCIACRDRESQYIHVILLRIDGRHTCALLLTMCCAPTRSNLGGSSSLP